MTTAPTDTQLPARLEDVLARITRALEAVRDGDTDLAEFVLDDLADDLRREADEREHA